MAEKKTISIKLLVNNNKKKLVFSFLTLPISTIIKLSPKNKSELGSMDSLYRSVESLHDHYFETPGCKSMLLEPKTPSLEAYGNIAVNKVYKHKPSLGVYYYICPTWTCATETHCLVSMEVNAKCACGQDMNRAIRISKLMNVDGLFVKRGGKFIVTDDLRVRPDITETSLSDLWKYGVYNGDSIKERIVSVGVYEVLGLLNRSLLSMTSMSDVFLSKSKSTVTKSKPIDINSAIPKTVPDTKMVSLTLFVVKPSDKASRKEENILYALAKEDFVDFLLGILTFPVGSVIKLAGKSCHLGSLNTLYGSVENLCKDYPTQFKESKDKLLHPKISRHYGCGKQLLKMEVDDKLDTHSILKCETCFNENIDLAEGESCKHDLLKQNLRLLTPKYVDIVCKSGGGFIKKPMLYMVTDDLKIEPHSFIACFLRLNKLGLSPNDLEERDVTVGEHEALSILKASLTSRTVLTDVFCKRSEQKSSA